MKQEYRLPFQSNIRIISQGYNGPYSHKIWKRHSINGTNIVNDDRFSVDFVCLPGTPVLASRNGIVLTGDDTCSRYYNGEEFEKGIRFFPNFMILRHEDDSFSLYSHLKKDSIRVRQNQRVAKGQVIAETGLSGWIGRVPHLHFEAYNPPHGRRKSFPVVFEDFDGPLEHAGIAYLR